MDHFVALLRGINVGKAKRVAMADFRAMLKSLGFQQVQTLLNSGNAVFAAGEGEAGTLARQIQHALLTQLSIDAQVIVKTAADIHAVVAGNVLGAVATDPARLLVTFTQETASLSRLHELTAVDWTPELFVVGTHAAYTWCPNGVLDSKASQAVNRQLGERVTTRNWATVLKLDSLLQEMN
jgi:uncharacterized protein (DUF1697 family)